MTLSEELTWRGFVNQTTLPKVEDVNTPRTFYWGVDPSADSMTVGHLAPAMMIRHFINHGHKAILLVGGATGMVGDPDGKKQERDLKTIEEITDNKSALAKQYKTVFNNQDFEVVDNYDWFKELNYLDFLRDIGKHAPMTQMLDRDFIKNRIGGDGISYAEFSYSLIQGYDFLHLFREKGATMQVAGADQWGNSISGVQLIRRIAGGEAHVWTTPLVINKSTGVKFGKTEAGAVWLDEAKTSVYQFYQFWLNCDDESVIDFLKIYTMLSKDVIEDLAMTTNQNPHLREAQKKLAYEVTQLIHGEMRALSAQKVSEVLFGGASFVDLTSDELDMLSTEIPTVTNVQDVSSALLDTSLVSSASEVRRLIENGAISVNGKKISENQQVHGSSLIKKGKNSFILVR